MQRRAAARAARRARRIALRRHHRQPDGPDGGSKGGFKGYDAGKRIHGRKRHILTDTDGRLLALEVHAADIQDRDGAKGVLKRSRARFPFVEHVFADGGYAGRLVQWAKDKTHVTLEIVRRMPWMEGFVVIRRRWVVERTFAWIMKCRRLVRDYEQLTRVSETLILIAATATLVRRWT
jgi:putative transposase